jgi:small subunit ribosomal protein S16
MAVVIRLKRTGAKKDTAFRIVVADSRRARDGRFVEQLGFYDPTPREARYKVDVERAQYWLGVGAQCSDQVRSLLKKAGVALPVRAKKAKPAEKPAKGAKGTKSAKGAKAKSPSARERARRVRKKADRVARKAVAAKAKTKAAKKAEAPAASS